MRHYPKTILLLLTGCSTLLSVPVSAAIKISPPPEVAETIGLPTLPPWLALAVVVVIILGVLPLLRRLSSPAKVSGNGPFQLLSKQQIDSRNSLVLVRCGSRLLVLANNGGELQTLSEIVDPEEVELLTRQSNGTEPPRRRVDRPAEQHRMQSQIVQLKEKLSSVGQTA